MDSIETLGRLKTIIKNNADLAPLMEIDDIKLESSLQQDMGFDSLALMSLLYELQEEGYQLDEDILDKWNQAGDIVQSMLITPPVQNS